MFEFVNKLFSGSKKSSSRAGYKPSFDDLESRQLMSVSSAAIHALPPGPGGTQASVVYFDSKHLLAVNGAELPQNIKNTPQGIQTFSVGRDAIGALDVFVQASDKSIWKYNEGDWTKVLGPANGVTSFAAVDGDRAYAIYNDGSLHEFNGAVWSKVPQSTTVTAIDAITDGRGNDAVFALNTNGSFGEYFGGHFTQMMPANARLGKVSVTLGTFSAATDQFGDGIVYGSLIEKGPLFSLNLGVYEINFNGTQTFIANHQEQFSGTNGALWITTTTGALLKYDASGLHTEPASGVANSVSLSAAGGNFAFYVSSNTVIETVLGTNGNPTEVISFGDYGHVTQ